MIHNSYREACVALGLLLGDEEWDRLLSETASYATPTSLRGVFITILLECSPAEPLVSIHTQVYTYLDHHYLSSTQACNTHTPSTHTSRTFVHSLRHNNRSLVVLLLFSSTHFHIFIVSLGPLGYTSG